jgi:hypothetical protein
VTPERRPRALRPRRQDLPERLRAALRPRPPHQRPRHPSRGGEQVSGGLGAVGGHDAAGVAGLDRRRVGRQIRRPRPRRDPGHRRGRALIGRERLLAQRLKGGGVSFKAVADGVEPGAGSTGARSGEVGT